MSFHERKDQDAFFGTCPRGLQTVLSVELERLGARNCCPVEGGVAFSGPFSLCYRVNLESRIASRVLWKIGQGPYRTEDDIYRSARALPWPDWFSVTRTMKVSVAAQHCHLKSLDFVTLRIKDAICDGFRMRVGSRPTIDTRCPDIHIVGFLDSGEVTFYLDTSGEPLFKRGWGRQRGIAPIRENLAAGILGLIGWKPGQVLLDPMCGSGTFLLEAAQIAGKIAPGLQRSFAFQKFRNFDDSLWQGLCEKSRMAQKVVRSGMFYGCDQDGEMIRAMRTTVKHMGLQDALILRCADALTLKAPAREGVLVTNPPYGMRLSDQDRLADLYPRLGDVLKQRFAGWKANLFTADRRLPKLLRLAPSRKIPLYNGDLECRVYQFHLVLGSNRKVRRLARQGTAIEGRTGTTVDAGPEES